MGQRLDWPLGDVDDAVPAEHYAVGCDERRGLLPAVQVAGPHSPIQLVVLHAEKVLRSAWFEPYESQPLGVLDEDDVGQVPKQRVQETVRAGAAAPVLFGLSVTLCSSR